MGGTNGDSTGDFNWEPGDPDFEEFSTSAVLVGDTAHQVNSLYFGDYTIAGGDRTFTEGMKEGASRPTFLERDRNAFRWRE